MAKALTKKEKAELRKKKAEEKIKKQKEKEEAEEKEKEEAEKQKEEKAKKEADEKEAKKKGDLITCNRCSLKYKASETIIREQKKCCPNCEAPQEWLR